LRRSRIDTLDFVRLTAAFDGARAANPSLQTWKPTTSDLRAALLGASDSAALGGLLAYAYAHDGSLQDMGYADAVGQLGLAGFGSAAQSIIASAGQSGGGVAPLSAPAGAALLRSTDAEAAASTLVTDDPGLAFITLADEGAVAMASEIAFLFAGTSGAEDVSSELPGATSKAPDLSFSMTGAPVPFTGVTAITPLGSSEALAPGASDLMAASPDGAVPTLMDEKALADRSGGLIGDDPSLATESASTSRQSASLPAAPSADTDLDAIADGPLFPASALLRMAMTPLAEENEERIAKHRSRVPDAAVPAQWDAIDAWSALQQANLAFAAEPISWRADPGLGFGAAEAERFESDVPAWQVQRIERAAAFRLVQLS
jgi:hypothetical protein